MERYGYTIFCDDIRAEDGGKLSFIGCYNAAMFTSSAFPIKLTKLCVHMHIFSRPSRPYMSVMARCYLPGETTPVADEAIDVPSLADQEALLASLPNDGKNHPYIVVAASLVFAPLEIIKPGSMDIRALINGGPDELHLGSLMIARS